MNRELEVPIKELAIEQLMKTPAGNKIQFAMNVFEKTQTHLYALMDKEGEEKQTLVKSATVMTFGILGKLYTGKAPKDFDSDDWKEIADNVSQYAVLPDDSTYTKYIFKRYEDYIRFSAEQIAGYAPEKTVSAINGLADELAEKAELFDGNEINEVTYIEECLWICLEAMIKLVASTASRVAPEEYAEYAQALAAYAFEYGRYMLYRKEQAIITEFIEGQHKLDEALAEKYAAFIDELEKQTEQFYVLIDNAFVPDFREAFLNSIILAKAAGVEEKEILTSVDDIDGFFMD